MERIEQYNTHGGTQGVYRHDSKTTGTAMTFSVFIPGHEDGAQLPVIWYLSGLTCTHSNVTEKGEFRAACAEHGVIFIAPDTSPRGEDVADDEAYDFGKGAGFYVDATQDPWAKNFRMKSYIETELPTLTAKQFPMADMKRQGITGHSMGGHGALTIGLRNPERFRSVSAFSPIVSPLNCPWGEKALGAYLGEDRSAWRAHDACALIADGHRVDQLLVDQGAADKFLTDQLKPDLLEKACADVGIALTLNMREGYDHSYYFVSTFLADHIAWHAARLK
ncbi:S-formylglutathione hydrolase [Parasphingopyxis lamellibrachiae]|uniref:S-formylglutathione hydrolase n=1 Tax=Parasphingopyxis lamellibrachiae TaxID=680125 RepID=A0A3D9F8Q0_9SPHN|nr:S-formylglutathione hydrolase [Parasphingopyxis lamellibrachiae]RED13339.1 S-formylglutathione hydrolase [Parasphingopyxis lamellibrachiae]